jgi:hypothetical protein
MDGRRGDEEEGYRGAVFGSTTIAFLTQFPVASLSSPPTTDSCQPDQWGAAN